MTATATTTVSRYGTAVDILTRGKEALLEHGWGRNHLACKTGEVCALGALLIGAGARYVMTDFDNDEYSTTWVYPYDNQNYDEMSEWLDAYHAAADTLEAAMRALTAERGDTYAWVPAWNDYGAKDMQDVVNLFDRAIASAA